MGNTSSNNNNGGIGFVGLLTIVFIVLKLTGVIDWTWFWVLSPIIFSTALVVLVLIIVTTMVILQKKGNNKLWRSMRK